MIPLHKDDGGETREQVVGRALGELITTPRWNWVTFECGGSVGVIEVAREGQFLVLNVPHAERDGLIPKLQRLTIAIPAPLRVKRDKKKGFLSSGFLEIEAQTSDKDVVTAFIVQLGQNLLGWDENQIPSACLQ